jgi:hypothetical protein
LGALYGSTRTLGEREVFFRSVVLVCFGFGFRLLLVVFVVVWCGGYYVAFVVVVCCFLLDRGQPIESGHKRA